MVRFTDIRSGLGRTSLSTSFEETSSPTDVMLRNITKTLCSPRCGTPRSGTQTPRYGTQTPRCGTQTPRCGTQTPRAMRRVSAGVPPTSSVARKMEFSPQVKKRRSDISRHQRGDSTNKDEDILLSSSIFDEDGSDEYAIVPKPTRNLQIPEFLLSGAACRSESVNYRSTGVSSEVCATVRSDHHMAEPWQFGILSLDVGLGTDLNTNSLPSGLSVTHATHSSQPEFITMSPSSKPCSDFGLSNAGYQTGWPSYSSTALPHINTFSHMPASECLQLSPKSAFKPVVRSGRSTSPRMDSQQYSTSEDAIGFPLSATPGMHKAFAPFDMPCALPSPFLLSPTLTGLEQLCYPSNTFVPNSEIQNCAESEDRLEMTTPVLILDQPVNTPAAREDKMSLALDHPCSRSLSVTLPELLPNLYPFEAGVHFQANLSSCKAGVPDLPTYHLPVSETRNTVECNECFIGAGSCFCSDIQLRDAECSSSFQGQTAVDPIQMLQRNGDAGDPFPVLHNTCDVVDPPQMLLDNGNSVDRSEMMHNKFDAVDPPQMLLDNGNSVDRTEILHNMCDASDPPQMLLNHFDTVEMLHKECDVVSPTHDELNTIGCLVNSNEVRYNNGEAPDPMLPLPWNVDSNAENKTVATSNATRSRKGGMKKRVKSTTWSKPVSVRETLENRRRKAADCNLANTTAVGSVCSDVGVVKPTVTVSWAGGQGGESSTCSASLKCLNAKQNGVVLPCVSSHMEPASDITTGSSREHVSFNAAHPTSAESGNSFGWKQTQSLLSDSRMETNNSTAKTTVAPALRSVPSDVGDEFALIGEPQICKRPSLSLYSSHIRNPKKEMIQVYENNHRRATCEKPEISNAVMSHPASSENGFNAITRVDDTYVDAVDLSKNTSVDRNRCDAMIQSMVRSPSVTSASPIYPYLLNVTREYEMLLLASQLSANSLHVAFSQGGTDIGQYAYAPKIVSIQNHADRYVDVATVSSSSDPVETRSKHPVFARLNDEQLGNVFLKYS